MSPFDPCRSLPSLHRRRALLVAALVAGASACGGPAGPQMGGIAPASFYAGFTGTWRADDDAALRLREAMMRRGPARSSSPGMFGEGQGEGRGGGMEGRGGFGGRGGEGGEGREGGEGNEGGGRRGMGRGAARDAAAQRAAMRMATRIPTPLSLTVGPSGVTVRGEEPDSLTLPLDGSEVKVPVGDAQLKAKATWDGAVLVIHRSLGRVTVSDRYEAVAGGQRILDTRRIDGGPGGSVEATFGYGRGKDAGEGH